MSALSNIPGAGPITLVQFFEQCIDLVKAELEIDTSHTTETFLSKTFIKVLIIYREQP